MKIITAIAIFAIVAALGAVAVSSMMPIHEVSASNGGYAQGSPSPNANAFNQGTTHAFLQTPHNQPCSTHCNPP